MSPEQDTTAPINVAPPRKFPWKSLAATFMGISVLLAGFTVFLLIRPAEDAETQDCDTSNTNTDTGAETAVEYKNPLTPFLVAYFEANPEKTNNVADQNSSVIMIGTENPANIVSSSVEPYEHVLLSAGEYEHIDNELMFSSGFRVGFYRVNSDSPWIFSKNASGQADPQCNTLTGDELNAFKDICN